MFEKEDWKKSTKERRKDVSKIEEVEKGNLRLSILEKQRVKQKYQIDAKGYPYIIQ